MKKALSFLVTALVVSTAAHAQDKTADIDKIFSWVTPGMPGCAVAASQQGKQVVNRAYGIADLESKVPITPDTIFDAGSVVKQFVAASVLLLVEEGRLSLTDDVRKYIPELPDSGHKITVDHLLTHTSGVRDWTAILPFAAGDPDALTVTLRQRGLNFAPGEEWGYSNSGYVLLKEMVARVSKMSFGDFTQITAGQNGLTLILEHLPVRRVDLSPVDRDTFQRGGMTVRFHRETTGQVVAFDWSNPVNRNIKFTRLSE